MREPHHPDNRHVTTVVGGDGSIQHRDGERWPNSGRNLRSVWTIATEPYKGAHFATFPQALVTPCILAGSRPGDVVLDPFTGSGTVGVVCRKAQRRFVGIDLSMDYLRQAQVRVENKDVDVKIEGLPLFAGGEG